MQYKTYITYIPTYMHTYNKNNKEKYIIIIMIIIVNEYNN